MGATSRLLSQAVELIRAHEKMMSAAPADVAAKIQHNGLKLLIDELGESGPTQKAFISGYLSSLTEAQKQCPASRLQCPSSSVAENVPQQPKKAPTKTAALGEGEGESGGAGERRAGGRRR